MNMKIVFLREKWLGTNIKKIYIIIDHNSSMIKKLSFLYLDLLRNWKIMIFVKSWRLEFIQYHKFAYFKYQPFIWFTWLYIIWIGLIKTLYSFFDFLIKRRMINIGLNTYRMNFFFYFLLFDNAHKFYDRYHHIWYHHIW